MKPDPTAKFQAKYTIALALLLESIESKDDYMMARLEYVMMLHDVLNADRRN